MPRARSLRLAAAAACAGLSCALASPAPAATTPAPRTVTSTGPSASVPSASGPSTPTLPPITQRVDPQLSVGGPRLAQMSVITDLPAGVPAPPAILDQSWVLADMETGEIIAARAPHARLLPASTVKALTASVLIPRITPNTRITVTDADAGADGTRVGLIPGQSYSARNLFQGLLMASGNDAAYALARTAGGAKGMAGTAELINARARELGAHDTHIVDPSGLDAPGQTSSAYDLALIGREAMRNKDFRAYVTTRQVTFPGYAPTPTTSPKPATQASPTSRPSTGRAPTGSTTPTAPRPTAFKVGNHNKLLYNYAGTIGIKNGYTEAAKRTFISAVTRGGRTYLLTEMYGLGVGWRDQAKLYDWAFAHGAKARPIGRLVAPGEQPTPLVASPTSTATTAPTDAGTSAGGTTSEAGAPTTTAAPSTPSAGVHLDLSQVPLGPVGAAAGLLLLGLLGGAAGALRRERRREH
ncbi:MAG: serine hydrolase [Micrococcales bacterium]|nr:serine hydrolase [Micrococcales bacterium]